MDFSIVICAYNPDDRILTRCLQAVKHLDAAGINMETILVDNNSKDALRNQTYIREFAETIPSFIILEVKQQGVGYARRAAIEKAKGNHIVYIDADNEPDAGYLQQLRLLHQRYPNVGAWGPGEVTVDFIDGVDASIENFARGCFQERHESEISFSNEKDWQNCYPFGTGLCTTATLLRKYNKEADAGLLTMPGRNGKKLSSGEDTQMVLLCIREGFAAGVAPALKLSHIINRSRANAPYIERLIYGTYQCYGSSLLQVFPEQKKKLSDQILSPATFSRRALKKYLRIIFRPDQRKRFLLVEFLASQAGIYEALGKSLPALVKFIIKKMKVE